jgi:Ca2+-transporting ATPase
MRNWLFIGINLSMIAGQVLIIMVGGRALQVVHLNGAQWGYSIVLGFLSIPVAILTRCVPDDAFQRMTPLVGWYRKAGHGRQASYGVQRSNWDSALVKVREELEVVSWVHDGHLNSHDWRTIHQRKPGLKPVTVMVGLVAGSIGGWPRT